MFGRESDMLIVDSKGKKKGQAKIRPPIIPK
jgi:hypothetical protein